MSRARTIILTLTLGSLIALLPRNSAAQSGSATTPTGQTSSGTGASPAAQPDNQSQSGGNSGVTNSPGAMGSQSQQGSTTSNPTGSAGTSGMGQQPVGTAGQQSSNGNSSPWGWITLVVIVAIALGAFAMVRSNRRPSTPGNRMS